jgi:adenosylmethionine-8-amino-7-oxononanoate aminotransferase
LVTRIDFMSWLERDARTLLHSQHRREQAADALVWARGEGSELIDVDGRRYLDGLAGLWNVLVGHGRIELAAAATRQAQELAFVSSFSGATHARAIELAERLQVLLKLPAWRFFFTSGGAEAVEAALKTARYVWQRRGRASKTGFIAFAEGYHGTTIAAASLTGFTAYQTPFAPTLSGVHIVPSPRYDASVGVVERVEQHLDILRETIERAGPENLAALVAEPVLAAGGTIVPPPGYWPAVRKLCNEYDILLIADEVVTAFGRCGPWLALQRESVRADLICLAKGLTSGYFPLGAMVASPEIAALIDDAPSELPWWHALTNSAHPVGCAVALENLRILDEEQLLPRAAELGTLLARELQTQLGQHPRVREIRQCGLLAGVEVIPLSTPSPTLPARGREPNGIMRDTAQSDAAWTGQQLLWFARERGLVTRVRGSTLQFAPPYVTTPEQVQRMVVIARAAIDAL